MNPNNNNFIPKNMNDQRAFSINWMEKNITA